MNIVTPIPTTVVFNTANVNTESARRDNTLRETVPQTGASENSAAESGVGSESDRLRNPGQTPQPVVYERPQPQTNQQAEQATQQSGEQATQDNAEDPSAGRENAEARQQQQQEAAEQAEIQELADRDSEVRAHEQAHASVGGQYAGSPSYEFETGPDGQQYAVGGEVSIDISAESNPEDTIRKMQQVRAAALAPSEPSAQDLRVAQEANQIAVEARAELSQEQAEEANARLEAIRDPEAQEEESIQDLPELDEIVSGTDVSNPTRSLNEDPVAEAVGLETSADDFRQRLANRDDATLQRVAVIENFYQNVSLPRAEGLSQTA